MCWPQYRNSFAYGHVRAPGQKYTEFQLDATGSIYSYRFMSIADAMLTPSSMCWSIIAADNPELMKLPEVRKYYWAVTQALWKQRYRWEANFFSQNQLNLHALGVFGNSGLLVHELDTRPQPGMTPGLRYVATSPGEMYPLRNYQGRVTGYIRHFRWSARQAVLKWGNAIGKRIMAAYEKNETQLWDFLEFCMPNTEYDPHAIFNWRGKPYASVYINPTDYCIMARDGYRSFPWAPSAYLLSPEDDYADGPTQICLPELKTLNASRGMFLRQGHKAVEPAYLIADDGIVSLKTAPKAFNYGGLTEQGQPRALPLETGNIQINQEMIADSKSICAAAFLIDLFPLISPDKPNDQKTFLQMIEEANQRGTFLAPALGGQYSGTYGPMITRELDVLSFLSAGRPEGKRFLPKPPPVLKEAEGEFSTVFCSPLARALSGQKVAGFMKLTQFATEVAQALGRPEPLDRLNFDRALPEMGDEFFVPVDWMSTDSEIADIRKQRGQAQQAENEVKSLPGKAAMAKAQAIQAKAQAGQNIGGTLSGVPTGGMPMMPGQNSPGGRAFGQPG